MREVEREQVRDRERGGQIESDKARKNCMAGRTNAISTFDKLQRLSSPTFTLSLFSI